MSELDPTKLTSKIYITIKPSPDDVIITIMEAITNLLSIGSIMKLNVAHTFYDRT